MNAKRNEIPTTVEKILKKYPDVFDLDMFKEAPKHEARHYIPTKKNVTRKIIGTATSTRTS